MMIYDREIDDFVEIQLIILFTLHNLARPVTQQFLEELILSNCNINFGTFMIALDNLVKTDHIKTYRNKENRSIYEILERGSHSAVAFKKSIPIYIREPILEDMRPLLIEEIRKRRVRGGIVPVRGDEFSVECSLYDDDDTQMMSLNFYAGSKKQAERIFRRFKQHPDEIYEAIMLELTASDEPIDDAVTAEEFFSSFNNKDIPDTDSEQ